MDLYNDIEESLEILIMRKVYKAKDLALQPGHLRLGFDLLTSTLFVLYGNTKYSDLIDAVNSNPIQISELCSRSIEKVCKIKEWNKVTISIAFMAMKRIMKKTTISPIFIDTLSIIITPKMDRNSDEYCLPSQYKKYHNDHLGKQLLLNWINLCKTTTRNKSQSVVRQIISFSIKICQILNVNLENYQTPTIELDEIKNIVENMEGKMKLETRIRYITILIKTFFKLENISYEQLSLWLKTIPKKPRNLTNYTSDIDVHKLTNREMDAIYTISKKNIRNELIILLLSTTGMRVGGLSNLLVSNVCKTIGSDIIINENGKTKEKGGKWFFFVISPKVKIVLRTWLMEHRKNHSNYVFPGHGNNPLCTGHIRRIVKDIGKKAVA